MHGVYSHQNSIVNKKSKPENLVFTYIIGYTNMYELMHFFSKLYQNVYICSEILSIYIYTL